MSKLISDTKAALLMSIRPRFANLIFEGSKTIELRRTRPKIQSGDLVLVYVSSPTKALVGAFEVEEIISARPKLLWESVKQSAGLSKEEFDNYFQNCNEAHGIKITKAWRLPVKVSLETMRLSDAKFHPPQSYRYLPSEFILPIPTRKKSLRK